jgi:hypothetical protein
MIIEQGHRSGCLFPSYRLTVNFSEESLTYTVSIPTSCFHQLTYTSSTSSPARECVSPLRPKGGGGGQHSLASEEVGGANSNDGIEAWHSVYSVVHGMVHESIPK